MRVVNNKKESARIYLLNDIKSIITNVTHEKNEINTTIAALNNAIGGAPSGIDSSLIGDCKYTQDQLESALQILNRSSEQARSLDTSEEIPDEQYK